MNFTRHLTALRSKGYSVRAYIMWIVAVVLIPGLLFGGWLVFESARSQREQAERIADRETREVTATIDREMVNAKSILRSLVDSYYVQSGDLAAFHQHIKMVAKQTEMRIILADPARNLQLLHSERPFGPPTKRDLPPERMEAERQAVETDEPVLSDLFFGPTANQFFVAMALPMKRENASPYMIAIVIPSQKFAEILATNQISPDWVVTIFDRRNVIVARSENQQEFVGTRVYGAFSPPADMKHGVATSRGRDGRVFRWSWRRSDPTGWFISVGIPETVLNAPIHRAMLTYTGAALALFAVAMGLSYYFGGRISQSIGRLGVDRTPTREEFDVLFQSHPNGVLVLDSGGLIVLANTRVEEKFGYRHDELIGKPVRMLCPKHLHSAVLSWPSLMGVSNELTGERKDRSEFPIEIAANQVQTRSGHFIIMIVADITQRKLAEQQLAAAVGERDDLRRRLMQAQEAERLRLAHELHDQTGQSLAAVMLDLKSIESQASEAGQARLRGLRLQLEAMGKALHRVAHELRPASIDELGLASALSTYISDWSAQFGIEADFHCRDRHIDDLPDDVRTTLYRVVQEALTNIAKHAPDASSVSIVLDRSDTTLQLTIEDDGHGFDPNGASEPGKRKKGAGLGHAGMRERLALIGGELEIESTVGLGTTIYARVPLQQERLSA